MRSFGLEPFLLAASLAACGGTSQHADPVTITIVSAGTAGVVVSQAPTASPAPVSREAAVTRELVELDEPPRAVLGGLGLGGTKAGGPPRAASSAQPGSGPKAVISIMRASVSGGTVANASAVVAGMAAGFRRCVNRELAANPASVSSGSVTLTAKIGPNGEVLAVVPTGVTGLPTAAIACLQARVASAQFMPPDSGSAKIEIPLVVDLI